MFVFDLGDIIGISIIAIIILFIIINLIYNELKKIGKKNCYKCKHYKLHDVTSAGGYCRYRCAIYNRIDDTCSFNDNEHYEKCKKFKGE